MPQKETMVTVLVETKNKIKSIAAVNGKTMQETIQEALEMFIERHANGKPSA